MHSSLPTINLASVGKRCALFAGLRRSRGSFFLQPVFILAISLTSGLLGRLHAEGPNTGAVQPAKTSIATNSDFSLATKDPAWPDGWTHPKDATYQSEQNIHFVRLQSSAPGEMVLLYQKIELPSPRPVGIQVHVKVRYDNVQKGAKSWFDARVLGNFKTAEDKAINQGGLMPVPAFSGTSKGWVEKDVFVRVPLQAGALEILPALFQPASGTFDIAEISVYPATEDQLPKPAPIIHSATLAPAYPGKVPPELHVAGNHLETADKKQVWLQGLCVDSLEWSGAGEHILESIPVAIDQWKANAIRLPVKNTFWFGTGPWQKKGEGGVAYRQLIDAAIESANSRGAYLILDLHGFGPPTENAVAFWKDAALRYKNHPGVIFELFNEPHSMSWKVWRDGGLLNGPDNAHTELNAKENNETDNVDATTGMQALVNAVRSTGARNLVIAGGLGWGYNLSGIVNGFALVDASGNDGIMYSSHIYPWKKDWQKNTLDAAAKYPIFVGEVGTPPNWDSFEFIPASERYEDLSKGEWAPDMLGLIQKYKLNWTAFSFHPKCGPMCILDWNYTPTPYWGVFVKEALAGQQFGIKRMR